MKKTKIMIVALLLISCALSEDLFVVNDRSMTDMSVEELYSLEDALVLSLEEVFNRHSTKMPNGEVKGVYVVNPRSKKFHYPYCYSALEIGPDRRFENCTPAELVSLGYESCGKCKP